MATAALAWLGASCGGTDAEDTSSTFEATAAATGTLTYEAEGLARRASATGSQVTSEAGASAGRYVQLSGTPAVGAWLEFTLTNVPAGSYDMTLLYKSNVNRGIVHASVDGASQGAACNQYAAVARQQVTCGLGSRTLAAGMHTIRFTVTGKSAGSSGFMMVVDQIALTASGGGAGGGGGVTSAGGTSGGGGDTNAGGTTGGGGVMNAGGTSGGGGGGAAGGSPGGGGSGGAGGTAGASGAGRPGGACRAGATYPAPLLTGAPKLIYKPSGTVSSGTYEGPIWRAASGVLLFSDISFTGAVNPSQMLELTPPATVTTFVADAGLNGMAVDGGGAIFACSHKVQGIVSFDFTTRALTTIVDNVGGKKFNSPNDLVLRSDGTIYFTDPDFQLGSRTSGTGRKGIYRVSPGRAVSLIDGTFAEPNGIALSPAESVLYVADYNANVVRAFAVAPDGSTSGRRDFASVASPDGFAMDCLGNLYVASGGTAGTIQVFAPSGAKLGSIKVASNLSNMAFGGPDGQTLYITAGKALYSLPMNLPGYYD